MLHQVLLFPDKLMGASVQGIERIDHSLRGAIEDAGGKMGAPLTECFRRFMESELNAFELGREVRSVMLKTRRLIGFIRTSAAECTTPEEGDQGILARRDGVEGPYIVVPAPLLGAISSLLEDKGIRFSLRDAQGLTDGVVAAAVIDVDPEEDIDNVQAILDAVRPAPTERAAEGAL